MLLSLLVENWRCYGPAQVFTTVASREQLYGDRLYRWQRSRICPVAALYGANAAGKSTLVEALQLLQNFVIESGSGRYPKMELSGRRPDDANCSRIGVEFVSDEGIQLLYELRFANDGLVSEELTEISGNKERNIYRWDYAQGLTHPAGKNNAALDAYETLGPSNGTVLGIVGPAGSAPQEVRQAYRWFSQNLHVVTPMTAFLTVPKDLFAPGRINQMIRDGISEADTGIIDVDRVKVPLSQVDVSRKLLAEVADKVLVKPFDQTALVTDESGRHFILEPQDHQLAAFELVTRHQSSANRQDLTLPFSSESAGTRRYLQLLPALVGLAAANSRMVFVIDELEHSLHPLLSARILESFLAGVDGQAEATAQLIFTTHQTHLLAEQLFRRDETWFVEKREGFSQLARLSDFATEGVRKGLAIEAGYLQGRFGAIPS